MVRDVVSNGNRGVARMGEVGKLIEDVRKMGGTVLWNRGKAER